MTYYQQNRARQLKLAREYRELNREEINRKQRARYHDSATGYRGYLLSYQREYKRLYGGNQCQPVNKQPDPS